MRTRYGPGVSIPTTDGAEIEALAGSNPSFAAWEKNEPYTIALLIKGRSGGASTKHLYRSGSSSTGDHILFLTSGTTPNLRHQASGGGTVTITSSVAIVNDTTGCGCSRGAGSGARHANINSPTSSAGPLITAGWHTLARVWDGREVRQYVDGLRTNTTAVTATGSWPLYPVWLPIHRQRSARRDLRGRSSARLASPGMRSRWSADAVPMLRPEGMPMLHGCAVTVV